MVRHALTTFPDAADPFQERPDAHSGLDFAYERGRVRDDNTISNVAAGTVTLTDDITNYVEVTGAGTVSANTSGFTAGRIPLYEVVTASGGITEVTDRRTPFMPPGAGGDSGAYRGARLRLTSNQSITDNIVTTISWDEAAEDTDGFWDVGQPTRLTIPAGVSRVRTLGQLRWAGGGSTGDRLIRLTMNGTLVEGSGESRVAATDQLRQGTITTAVPVIEGDYFEMAVWQTTGGSLDVSFGIVTWFSIEVVE